MSFSLQNQFLWLNVFFLDKLIFSPVPRQIVRRYRTESGDIQVLGGKLACAKKGIAFSKGQLSSAAWKFKSVLSGWDYKESLNIEDITEDDADADADDGPDDDNENEEGDDTADDVSDDLNAPNTGHIQAVGKSIAQNNLFL